MDAVGVRDGKVLLIKRGNEPDKGKWALPGGLLDWDESASTAVLRELAEEAGAKGRAHTRGLLEILHREGHAVKRAERLAAQHRPLRPRGGLVGELVAAGDDRL